MTKESLLASVWSTLLLLATCILTGKGFSLIGTLGVDLLFPLRMPMLAVSEAG